MISLPEVMPFIFPVAFFFIAIATGKDLAYYCFAASVASLAVHLNGSLAYEAKFIGHTFISFVVAAHSWQRMNINGDRKPLASWICLLCSLSISNNLLQLYIWTDFSYYASIAIGIAMTLALIFIDGRREFWHDLADDFGLTDSHGIFGNDTSNHKKGHN